MSKILIVKDIIGCRGCPMLFKMTDFFCRETDCWGCSHPALGDDQNNFVTNEENEAELDKIPNWCPLPDEKKD